MAHDCHTVIVSSPRRVTIHFSIRVCLSDHVSFLSRDLVAVTDHAVSLANLLVVLSFDCL